MKKRRIAKDKPVDEVQNSIVFFVLITEIYNQILYFYDYVILNYIFLTI